MKNKISIIIPTFNCANTIQKAINSVLIQNIELEIIVIDDGSTDNTVQTIEEIDSPSIRLITLKQNGGVSHARNIGMKTAIGDYIMFLDADDYLSPGILEKMIVNMDEKTDIVFCGYRTVDRIGHEIKSYPLDNTKTGKKESAEIFFQFMDYGITMMSSCAKLFRRSKLAKLSFNEQIKNSEDFSFMIDLFQSLSPNIKFIDTVGYNYLKTPKKRKYREDSVSDHLYTIKKLYKYAKQEAKYSEIEYKISNCMYNQIASDLVTFVRCSKESPARKINLFSKVRKQKIIHTIPITNSLPFKRRLFALSIKTNPLCGYIASHFVR